MVRFAVHATLSLGGTQTASLRLPSRLGAKPSPTQTSGNERLRLRLRFHWGRRHMPIEHLGVPNLGPTSIPENERRAWPSHRLAAPSKIEFKSAVAVSRFGRSVSA